MRIIIVALLAGIFTSCRFTQPGNPDTAPVGVKANEEPEQVSTVMLLEELEVCEAQLEEASSVETTSGGSPEPDKPPKTKEAARSSRRCGATDGPEIVEVITIECMPGYTCLDDKATIALAKNLTAYESWVQRELDCKSK